MTEKKFIQVISHFEVMAQRSPFFYKCILLSLVALSYFYMFVVFTSAFVLMIFSVVLAVAVSGIFLKIAIPFLLLGIWIVKSLWVKFEVPAGLKIENEPALENLVEDVRSRVKGPHINKIIITKDFNAAVVQIPRLGLFGWYKRYLVLGYPLMQSVDENGLRAIIAHELAHLSKMHGRTGNLVFRTNSTWSVLLKKLSEKNSNFIYVFIWFFSWFVPYFDACSFVLRRKNEHEADYIATKGVDVKQYARTMCSVEYNGYRLNKFWDEKLNIILTSPLPPDDIYTQLESYFKENINSSEAENILNEASLVATKPYDSHPSFGDRLKSIEEKIYIPENTYVSSAKKLLINNNDILLNNFNREWVEGIKSAWQERYNLFCTASHDREELEKKRSEGKITEVDRMVLGRIKVLLEDYEGGLNEFKDLLNDSPEFFPAMIDEARLLVKHDPEESQSLLLKAMSLDITKEYLFEITELLYQISLSRNDNESAVKYYNLAVEHEEKLKKDSLERDRVTVNDMFSESALDTDNLEKIRYQLLVIGNIKEAVIAQKITPLGRIKPLYVLGVMENYKNRFYKMFNEIKIEFGWKKSTNSLVHKIATGIDLPEGTLIVNLDLSKNKKIYKKMSTAGDKLL